MRQSATKEVTLYLLERMRNGKSGKHFNAIAYYEKNAEKDRYDWRLEFINDPPGSRETINGPVHQQE